tara:strand:- start:302 stop:469 length:168 start_codon:yes stop_codon:yes gene_type:complete
LRIEKTPLAFTQGRVRRVSTYHTLKEETMFDLSPLNNKEVLQLLRPKIFKNIPII